MSSSTKSTEMLVDVESNRPSVSLTRELVERQMQSKYRSCSTDTVVFMKQFTITQLNLSLLYGLKRVFFDNCGVQLLLIDDNDDDDNNDSQIKPILSLVELHLTYIFKTKTITILLFKYTILFFLNSTNAISCIPKNLSTIFPNLKVLTLVNKTSLYLIFILTIKIFFFCHFKKNRNHFVNLKSFEYLPKTIEFLTLNQNKIESTVNFDTFKHLVCLKR